MTCCWQQEVRFSNFSSYMYVFSLLELLKSNCCKGNVKSKKLCVLITLNMFEMN